MFKERNSSSKRSYYKVIKKEIGENMMTVRNATRKDIEFLSKKDIHISYEVLEQSIDNGKVCILEMDYLRIGWLRYNLFWDNTPFMNMFFIEIEYRNLGYGKFLLDYWENQMQSKGYQEVLTSTLVHEEAIHFYLKHGYKVVGGFHPSDEEYEVILKKKVWSD